MIRQLEPTMSKNVEYRTSLQRFIHMLVDPMTTAQPYDLRVLRNRYLFMICVSLMTKNEVEMLKLVFDKHKAHDANSLKVTKPKPKAKVAGFKVPKATAAKVPPVVPVAPVVIKIADDDGMPLSIVSALTPKALSKKIWTEAEWEREKSWEVRKQLVKDAEAILAKLPKPRVVKKSNEKVRVTSCSVHNGPECPTNPSDVKIGKCLDLQFAFLLNRVEFQVKILLAMKQLATEQEKINLWLHALSSIDDRSCCQMKGIRNDYIMLLLGYVRTKELKGPFEDFPPEHLQPLTRAIATYIAKREQIPTPKEKAPLNPIGDTVEDFMNKLPNIAEGAFALLSLSGNLFNAAFKR